MKQLNIIDYKTIRKYLVKVRDESKFSSIIFFIARNGGR